MDYLRAVLPEPKGYLPYYMLLLSLIATWNGAQNYMTLHFSRRFYNGRFIRNPHLPPADPSKPKYNPEDSTQKLVPAPLTSGSTATKEGQAVEQVTPLGARLFGTWTLVSAIVRIYACYHLHLAPMYQLAMWTYAVALGHFVLEDFVYGTCRPLGGPQLAPLVFAVTGLVWMSTQYNFYVEA